MEYIAKVAQKYGGEIVQVGQRFHVEPKDVYLLSTLGRIEESRDSEAGEPAVYETRDMAARTKRAYNRKAQ